MVLYSAAFSYLVLAGTGIYCAAKYSTHRFDFPHGTFGIIIATSVVGVWRYGNPHYGECSDKLSSFLILAEACISLPWITTTVWCGYGYMSQVVYAHTILALAPLVAYTFNLGFKKEYHDVVMGFSAISLCVVSYINCNYYGIAAAVSYVTNYFIIYNLDDYFEIPTQALCNIALCFFAYFSLRAVSEL